MRQSVVLACGHVVVVTHEAGERAVHCMACPESSVVKATKVTTIEYTITPIVPTLFESGDS